MKILLHLLEKWRAACYVDVLEVEIKIPTTEN